MQAASACSGRDGLVRSHCAAPGESALADVALRVARALADVEAPAARAAWQERCRELITSTRFLPSIPILSNAGRGGQLAACFVLEARDSLDSIYATLARAARIQQGSGGTGVELSSLRPRGTPILRSGGKAPGPVGFLELFAASARVNRSAGRRPGAHLGVLRADHPDVLEFVRAKRAAPRALAGIELAVAIPDSCLAAVGADGSLSLVDGQGAQRGSLRARVLLDEIAAAIHATGEPCVLFSDALERGNPLPELGRLRATNPCGEQPLLPGESCVLGSLQLPAFADGSGQLDLDALGRAAEDGVRLLDDVIDAGVFPDPEIARASGQTRKIGLGLMGLADVLLLRGLPYDCAEARDLAAGIAGCIAERARTASRRLAAERGAYPAARADATPQRNATLLAIAPTGVISLIAGCSAGIEPFLQPVVRLPELGDAPWRDRWLADWLERRGAAGPELWDALERGVASPELPGIGAAERRLLRRAWEIDPAAQLQVQAALQAHVDGAVSKTVHLPQETRADEIRELLLLAHRLGCKGASFFRRGCEADLHSS
jgi:ribonucleoside-diphosphate reductase alpha chain